ncbi:MAG: anthranilate synthase component I family protein [Candidatus Helarchaeota archaeon]
MEFDIHIEKLGEINNVFEFYKYIINKNGTNKQVLLESVSENTREPLFSFMAFEPDFMLEIKNGEYKIYDITTERGEKIKEYVESREDLDTIIENHLPFQDNVENNIVALDILEKLTPYSRLPFTDLFPRNIFYGGYAGYIGYDVVAPWVSYESTNQFPDVLMGLFTKVLIYSNISKALYLIDNSINDYSFDKDIRYQFSLYKRGRDSQSIDDIPTNIEDLEEEDFRSNTTQYAFEEIINNVKEHIFAGDIIQAVISRRLYTNSKVNPISIYEILRILNPSPYMFCINFDDKRIIGSSPEALITKNKDKITTVPIAGTRPRGRDNDEDHKLEMELLNDPKEFAEHIMLVDLARNDIAKVSYPGSIETTELMKIKKYRKVMHLVSKVQGKTPFNCFKVLKSIFPAGTLTGAPKLRAMQIIQEYETENRGPYGGVVGYFTFNGDMDFAIAIRTLFGINSNYFAQAGSGIVADSQPYLEFLESHNKMYSILKSIKIAEAKE